MKYLIHLTIFIYLILNTIYAQAQIINDTSILSQYNSAFEEIIVETYYIADENDAGDTDGGNLPEEAVTYRIFIDMKPGYLMGTIFGDQLHELRIETSTQFFNNEDRGEQTGNKINAARLDCNTVALDSWITIGAASSAHFGVLKSEDPDGSLIGGLYNDGGSESISGGLLVNDDEHISIPLTTADGLIPGIPPEITTVGLDLEVFGDQNDGPVLSASNGGWTVLGGYIGQNEENRVLIAQITTDGELYCKLNFSIYIPDSIRCAKCTICDNNCPSFINYYAEIHPDDSAQLENSYFKYLFFERPELSFTLIPPQIDNTDASLFNGHAVSIFPNPASDAVNIKISSDLPGSASYSVFDVYGKRIIHKQLGVIFQSHLEHMDISALSPGVYFIRVKMNESVLYNQIVKF